MSFLKTEKPYKKSLHIFTSRVHRPSQLLPQSRSSQPSRFSRFGDKPLFMSTNEVIYVLREEDPYSTLSRPQFL